MHLWPYWCPQQGPAFGQNVGSEREWLYKSCWRCECSQRRGRMAGGSLQNQLHNICKHILWWHSPQWEMGSECSTLWHKVSGQNIVITYIFHESLKSSTAYVWIGMISRSNPSRDGVVVRAQRHILFNYYHKNQHKHRVCVLSRRINHPSFNNGSPPNYDFQLIELSTSVDLTDPKLSHVFPACWPTSEPTSGRVMMHNCAYIYSPH